MNYTIATIEDVTRTFKVDFIKDGKNYVVTVSNADGYASKIFDNINDAYDVFAQQAKYICYGIYSDNDRFLKLMEGDVFE